MKPIGHDGKPMSDEAWKKLHQVLAQLSAKYSIQQQPEYSIQQRLAEALKGA